MTAETDLPPLPEDFDVYGANNKNVQDYARACVSSATEALRAEVSGLREDLAFVERWANHHAQKPRTTAAEALNVIQHYPTIRAITESYSDGVIPPTRNPYAEVAEAEARAERLAEALRESAQHLRNHADNEYQMRFEDNSPSGRLNRLLMLADRIEANAARAALEQETTNG